MPVDDWITSKKRKVHQRKLNALVRDINRSIRNDSLWQGRFFIRQYSADQFYKYEDNSGGTLYVRLRIYDKEDMKYQEYFGDTCVICHFNGARLWFTVNDFITEISSAWESDPYKNKKSYLDISEDYVISNATAYPGFVKQVRFL